MVRRPDPLELAGVNFYCPQMHTTVIINTVDRSKSAKKGNRETSSACLEASWRGHLATGRHYSAVGQKYGAADSPDYH